MPRNRLYVAAAIALFGLVFCFSRWPAVSALQIVIPFVFGLAAGVMYGRGRPRPAGLA
ncbi:hypothetical protein tb265_49820 [Gemmatimonadetes bacterium T265]|nr:hypothetical protein tb265_49820 [Gemmatimonadetes bacterium T265]